LSVGGDLKIENETETDDLNVKKNAAISGNLNVDGTLTAGDLTVNGKGVLTDDVRIETDLDSGLIGGGYLSDGLSLQIASNVLVNNNDKQAIQGDLNVVGLLEAKDLEVENNVTVGGNLNVTGTIGGDDIPVNSTISRYMSGCTWRKTGIGLDDPMKSSLDPPMFGPSDATIRFEIIDSFISANDWPDKFTQNFRLYHNGSGVYYVYPPASATDRGRIRYQIQHVTETRDAAITKTMFQVITPDDPVKGAIKLESAMTANDNTSGSTVAFEVAAYFI